MKAFPKNNALEQEKNQLRKEAKKRRLAFYTQEPHTHAAYSARIVEKLLSLIHANTPQTIMVYYPLAAEVDIRPLLTTLHNEKSAPILTLPRTCTQIPTDPLSHAHTTLKETKSQIKPVLKPVRLDKTRSLMEQLTSARYGIMEVREGILMETSAIDLVIVPGLLFDLNGQRLGYGGGFYDQFISLAEQTTHSTPPIQKIGVCFEFQKHLKIPTTPHDQPLSQLITEQSIYTF